MDKYKILVSEPSSDYELLDSGGEEKLERYGKIIVRRPDSQAFWQKALTEKMWAGAHAHFAKTEESGGVAKWKKSKNLPDRWEISLVGLKFWISLTAFKHTGIFPEQVPNWQWLQEKIKNTNRKVKVLNLFGYTGGASLASLKAGAEVCHVDGSKSAVSWASDNASLSGLSQKPIRWILDDARAFVRREIKRGNLYDGIIMDPPAFGHGAKKQTWKIEKDFLPLLLMCEKIFTPKPLFFLINGYASGYSALAYKNCLEKLLKNFNGFLEIGELTIRESQGRRLLPAGIFARWSSI